jgi:hypothetical protein
MSEIEELQVELENLKKSNLMAQIAKEKIKAEEEQRLKKEVELEKLRNEVRQEILGQIESESKIKSNKPIKLDSPNSDFEEFKTTFAKKLKITGEPYESYIKKLAYKEYNK